jgi:hypothetical protein
VSFAISPNVSLLLSAYARSSMALKWLAYSG